MNPQVQAKMEMEKQPPKPKVLPLAPPPPPKNKTGVKPLGGVGFTALKQYVTQSRGTSSGAVVDVGVATTVTAPSFPGAQPLGHDVSAAVPPDSQFLGLLGAAQVGSVQAATLPVGSSHLAQGQPGVTAGYIGHATGFIPDKNTAYQQHALQPQHHPHQQQLYDDHGMGQQQQQAISQQQQQQLQSQPLISYQRTVMSPHGSIHSDSVNSQPNTPSYNQGTPNHPLTPGQASTVPQMFTFPPRTQDLQAHLVAVQQQQQTVQSPHVPQSPGHVPPSPHAVPQSPHGIQLTQNYSQVQHPQVSLPQLHQSHLPRYADHGPVAALEHQMALAQNDPLTSLPGMSRQDTVPYSQGEPTLDEINDHLLQMEQKLEQKQPPNIFFGSDAVLKPPPPQPAVTNTSVSSRPTEGVPHGGKQPAAGKPQAGKHPVTSSSDAQAAVVPARAAHHSIGKDESNLFPRPMSKPDDVTRDSSQSLCASWPRTRIEEAQYADSQRRVQQKSSDQSQTSTGTFKNPPVPPAPGSNKRKHRPEPLVIPPHVNSSFGFASRLRSPRLWPSDSTQRQGMTPPPYTPPPMLSPVRSGSGLFWTLNPHPTFPSITPKSAPLTPKFRRASLSGAASSVLPVLPEAMEAPAAAEEVVIEEPPPETDILPHVNVGPQYQAEIPEFNPRMSDAKLEPDLAQMLWDPAICTDISEDEVQYFQDFACTAAVHGNGTNKEYALHLLHLTHGNVKAAMLRIMHEKPSLSASNPLQSFKYVESDAWTCDEINQYQQALLKFDKDFFNISREVGSKNVKQCVQFYYLWKKVCGEEYKRLRSARRRREQDELYNLRHRDQNGGLSAHSVSPGRNTDEREDTFRCTFPGCSATFNCKPALYGHVRVHGGSRENSPRPPRSKSPSPAPRESPRSVVSNDGDGSDLEEYPCKICGKVFGKVKSRSAHMKSHRQAEHLERQAAQDRARAQAMEDAHG